jgi:hypothetical protein
MANKYIKDYRVTLDKSSGKYKILNLRTGRLNRHTFILRTQAVAYSLKLAYWHKVNKSPVGIARTKRGTKKFMAAYYSSRP